MKIKSLRSYRNTKGNVVFVYAVSGTKAELAKFKEAQGDFYREDEKTGAPLWFTTRSVGQTGSLIITSKGRIVPDMSAFDNANSLAKQYGGNLGQALAGAAVEALLGKAPAAPATEDIAHEQVDVDALDESDTQD